MTASANPTPNGPALPGRPASEAPAESRLEEIYHQARAQDPAQRERFLDDVCGKDSRLRAEVAALLEGREQGPDFINCDLPGLKLELDPPTPEWIGPFRILDVIGRGGMGVVYLAEQREPRREVALKVIKRGMDTQEVLARFQMEHHALALMNHPNIAQVYDAGSTTDGQPYFVMERVTGIPITEYCDRHGLSPKQRLKLFLPVCHAVQHAHQKGVIHRDLKPSNIPVAGENGTGVAKIIDFGVAKAIGPGLSENTLTTELGRVIGTPEYMSPEQASFEGDLDTRTDVYSLGVVLYELLSGALPFDRETLRQDFQRTIRDVEPPRPSTRVTTLGDGSEIAAANRGTDSRTLARRLQGDLDWITMKALEKDRDRRYASASELAADLERHLSDEPVSAGPLGATYRINKFLKKNRRSAAVGAALFVVLVSTLAWALAAQVRADRNFEEIIRLADIQLVEEFQSEAEDLWPAYPRRIPDFDSWLERVRPLADRLTVHEESLRGLREAAIRSDEDSATTWTLPDNETQWRHDRLAELVTALRMFLDPNPAHGTVGSVDWRRGRALRMKERMEGAEAREAWRVATDEIRSLPVYAGLKIEPQIGLIPLGRNPDSGLWEFWHTLSGERPRKNLDPQSSNPWEITNATGLVLILVPGGSFTMGAQRSKPGEPNFDADARKRERPTQVITLEAFFISRYEMTRVQWKRMTGYVPPPPKPGPNSAVGALPMGNMSWYDAVRVTREQGLGLPTEAQWECAARAGTTTVWWTGNHVSSLAGAGNIRDLSRFAAVPEEAKKGEYEPFDDGHAAVAPVGSYRPNRWGLHDVVGNLYEWCGDPWGSYESRTAPGDGARQESKRALSSRRLNRGGSYLSNAIFCRSAARNSQAPENRHPALGLRPTLSLQR